MGCHTIEVNQLIDTDFWHFILDTKANFEFDEKFEL